MCNSKLYANLFSTPEMRQVWSDSSMVAHWLQIEQTLVAVQAEMYLIPTEAANAISEVQVENIDLDLLAEHTMLVGRPIVGFVKQLREHVGEMHSSAIHFGTTTQDIMDTATVLQMRQGLDLIVHSLQKIITKIEVLAKQHLETPMTGRTNGQWALPITFGMKAKSWSEELNRRLAFIEECSKSGLQVQLSGPVGNFDRFDVKTGLKLREADPKRLGLLSKETSWQSCRDSIGDIVLSLGQLGTTIEKISRNINLLSSSEVGELYELPAGEKGCSSSMAHKRNQRCSEFGEAIGRLIRGRATQIGETAIQEHERSGGAWVSEWLIIPDIFLLSSGALYWMQNLFSNLQVDTSRMAENLEKATEHIHLRLIQKRQEGERT